MFIGNFRRLLALSRRTWEQKKQPIFNLLNTTHQLRCNIVPVLSFAAIISITPNFNDVVCYIRTGNIDAFKSVFLSGKINMGDNNNQLIIEACNKGHVEIVKLLLSDPNVDPSDQFNKALFDICSVGGANLEIIEMLLKHPKINPSAGKVLYAAAGNSDWRVIDLILRCSKVDPSADDNEAIIQAAKMGYCELTTERLMQDPRVNPSARNNTAFTSAVMGGHYKTALTLLKDPRVDPFSGENAGNSPGEWAISILEARSGHNQGLLKILYNRRKK